MWIGSPSLSNLFYLDTWFIQIANIYQHSTDDVVLNSSVFSENTSLLCILDGTDVYSIFCMF